MDFNSDEKGPVKDEPLHDLTTLTPGTAKGFFVMKEYPLKDEPFDLRYVGTFVGKKEVSRLELSERSVTVPIALMIVDRDQYQSISRARKECRKGRIVIQRKNVTNDAEKTGHKSKEASWVRVRVVDRVYPGDTLGYQVRMGSGYFCQVGHKAPSFTLPVLFEDDHFAIVNKPAGVVVFSDRKGGHGTESIRAALPFVLKAPSEGTYGVLRWPQPCHRLDKLTSGLLLVAKTKPAMLDLHRQFRDRELQKQYVAIVNGTPSQVGSVRLTSSEIWKQFGSKVTVSEDEQWFLIDEPIDGRSARTLWRSVKTSHCQLARDQRVTLVALKPISGRKHQLRKHMACISGSAIIGDIAYDGGGDAMNLRSQGMFLCANEITVEHPFYNSPSGRLVYDRRVKSSTLGGGVLRKSTTKDRIMVTISIGVPRHFADMMEGNTSTLALPTDQ